MKTTQNVAPAIQEHLENIKNKIAKINDSNGHPIKIPNYNDLYAAAGKLDKTENPTQFMNLIQSLLGRAGNVGSETISYNKKGAEYYLKFPEDHRMHGSMGNEWYWLACHLNVTDQNNKKGKISILDTMQKTRSMGTDIQAKYNWTEEQICLMANIATVTVKMDENDETTYYRRDTNEQWPLKGGTSSFSSIGEPFSFKVGTDSLTGTNDVLPLRLVVNNEDNMQIDLTFTNSEKLNIESSFFKQGTPIDFGNGGTGITPLPTPGIYYSWPQVLVTGTITVGGNNYTVNSGIGWIDHQLMMSSILDADGKPDPKLFENTPTNYPYNGWIWQYYNLENGTSFTGAGFIQGEIPANNQVEMVYGYYLKPNQKKEWDATFIMGDLELKDPQNFPSICNDPHSTPVTIPIKRNYKGLKNIFDLSLLEHPISGQALPWYHNGTFNNPDNSLCAEFPADFISANPDHHPNGVGYLETVGFEKVNQHRAYALGILKG
ncbi:hydroxyneurosporene synthase CrtC [Tenacibaculum adriaticum]|uniref:Hydroxyneurosporene synthase CrtC n=1 Tax=Tenacibaculum adriaticum TaxID=413713 RepID=A0A5S5DWL0_9FLAO|nr:lipocalin-like domain-containing protein [Tenacibaculum adriaticum]TYP99446.1 hydroxyneurosporene synthase CrtC [Tenacibaculum adriaticum]